ncbi:hypothetical protein D187_000907 [Cystobacter fuscus DSM 2262]|uniref:Uncharacterized protein n=1 Tax=Cystobacter fuscus (strain ATCC 25194 / DSM 2262 / NBRC 100088 / M29) TaxID=1242864 RepID=S9QIQ1_CYSF2|nr:hypothetical protein D187_000907 [Cystobacter fuscus DSM 2262]
MVLRPAARLPPGRGRDRHDLPPLARAPIPVTHRASSRRRSLRKHERPGPKAEAFPVKRGDAARAYPRP